MLDNLLKSYLSLLTTYGLIYTLVGFTDVISLDEYASAVITRYHRIVSLKNRNVFCHSSGDLEVQDQGVSSFGVLQGLSPWLANGQLLSVPTHGLFPVRTHVPGV